MVVLECANCSVHAMVEGALSETAAMVSLSTVPKLSLASGKVDVRCCIAACRRLISQCVHIHGRDQMTLRT